MCGKPWEGESGPGLAPRRSVVIGAESVCSTLLSVWLLGAASLSLSASPIDLPDSLVASGAEIEVLTAGRSFCEGPAVAPNGDLYYTELGTNPTMVYRIRGEGPPEVFMEDGAGANGMVFVDGALIACRNGHVARIDTATGSATDLIADYNDITLGATNDLTTGPDGAIFFTNPNWGAPEPGNDVFRLSSEGKLTRIADGINKPNGIEYDPDIGRCYLCVSGDNKVVVTEVGANGDPGEWRDFADIDNPDGIELDRYGNVYVVSFAHARIQVYDTAGVSLGSIAFRSAGEQFNTTNCTFGWGEKPYLYVTASDRVFRLKMNVRGKRQYHQSQGVLPRGSSRGTPWGRKSRTPGSLRVLTGASVSTEPMRGEVYTPAGRAVAVVSPGRTLSCGVILIGAQ